MSKIERTSQQAKVQRAWGAYLELTATANWMDRKLSTTLQVFGLTREEFRLLAVLQKNGPLTTRQATAKLERSRRSLHDTVRHAEEFGWVNVGERQLPAADVEESRLPKERRGKPRFGPRVSVINLTRQGERLIGKILPKQETIVKALFGELDSRELDSLTRICRKLRQGDVLPFWFEVMKQNREFEESGEAGEPE